MKTKYIATKLENGAKLFYVKNKINKSTCVDVLFNCGCRCDTILGLAHFTEHMFFSGTNTLSREETFKKYSSYILTNAYTNATEICFNGIVFPSELGDYLSTVAMLITDSPFKPEAVEKEKKVINQEIAESNDKHERIEYLFNVYNLYNLPFYNQTTICGSTKSIAKITSKEVKQFVDKYFVANNMEVYISSAMSLKKVKSIVNKNIAKKLPVNESLEKLDVHFCDVVNKNFVKTKKVDIKKTYISLNFVFPKDLFDSVFARKLGMALEIVNDGSIGILKYLRFKKDLVYSAFFSYRKNKNNSILVFDCNCEKENVKEVIKTVAEYIQLILEKGFTEEQLQKIKRMSKHKTMCKEPSVASRMNILYDYRWYGKILDYKKLKKVSQNATLEDCNNVFKEAFTTASVSLSLYGEVDKANSITKKELNSLFSFCQNK